MTIIEGYFDKLHFTESNIGNYEYVGADLFIRIASGLILYSGNKKIRQALSRKTYLIGRFNPEN